MQGSLGGSFGTLQAGFGPAYCGIPQAYIDNHSGLCIRVAAHLQGLCVLPVRRS